MAAATAVHATRRNERRQRQSDRQAFGGNQLIATSLRTNLIHHAPGRNPLEPGGLRELHWHPNADEWQYYIKGRSEVGIFGANGKSRHDEFRPGDVAFIDRGFGHYIKQVGNEQTQILIAFNSPDYQEISISSWLASNPARLLADNFGIDLGAVQKLPHAGRFIVGTA